MKLRFMLALATLALAVGWSSRVLADDAWATNRFFGGSFDGYDANSLIQTDTTVYSSINARFKGGNFDGWNNSTAAVLKLPILGTVFIVH